MDKKQERMIFDAVFGGYRHLVVEESEEPDFVCIPLNGDRFGVEVTEFFVSESDARLAKIDDYVNDLIGGGDYRHKDDRDNIKVEDVVYRRVATGQETKLKAIGRDIPPHRESMPKLVRKISAKNAKFPRYSRRVTPIDLVVDDVDWMLRFDGIQQLMWPIAFGDAFNALIDSPFREIYVLTVKAENGRVFVPLRANLFAGEIAIFLEAYREFAEASGREGLVAEFVDSLAGYLASRFPTTEYFFDGDGMPRFVFASVSWGLTAKQRIELTDESCPDKSNWKLLAPDVDTGVPSDHLRRIVSERRANDFTCYEFHLPVAVNAATECA